MPLPDDKSEGDCGVGVGVGVCGCECGCGCFFGQTICFSFKLQSQTILVLCHHVVSDSYLVH